MSLRYVVENMLIYNDRDDIVVHIESDKTINYKQIEDESILEQDVVNIGCIYDPFKNKKIWNLYLW